MNAETSYQMIVVDLQAVMLRLRPRVHLRILIDLGFKLGLSLGFGPLCRILRAGKIRELTQPRSKLLLMCLGAYNLYITGGYRT
jgi:hypothetical protein